MYRPEAGVETGGARGAAVSPGDGRQRAAYKFAGANGERFAEYATRADSLPKTVLRVWCGCCVSTRLRRSGR